MAEDRLPLGPRHALAVLAAADGIVRAEPQRRTDAGWVRARPGDGAGAALLDRLAGAGESEEAGPFRVTGPLRGTGSFPSTGTRTGATERPVAVDQTNESWIVGEDAVVKWPTQPLVGPHPAAERLRRLAAAGFAATPRLRGLVEWRPSADAPWTLVASAVDYLPGAEDGWTWCLAEARTALGLQAGAPRPFAAELGRLTAAMHLALAGPRPSRLAGTDARTGYERALAELDRAVALTTGADPALGAELAARRGPLAAALAPLATAAGAVVVPVHGDLHVGQVLRDRRGVLQIIDFDGNPTRDPVERAADHPAALDVAGLLVSFENVGHVVRHYAPEVPEAAAADWSRRRGDEFLAAYRAELVRAGRTELLAEALLPAYRRLQLVREFQYAAAHLPRWMYVPAAGLRRWIADES